LQIKVSHGGEVEYVTDAGLVVPSISISLRKRIQAKTEECGLKFSIQAELMGRAAADVALRQVGLYAIAHG